MTSVSLCMIIKNEEQVLEKCLESISQIADEIIIVDTGSTDKSIEIAQKFTKNIHHFTWIDDFSAARNFADSFATRNYILRWDADWVLREGDLKKLQNAKKSGFFGVDMVNCTWVEHYTEDENGKKYPTMVQNLFFFYKRGLFHWQSPIHNELVANDQKFVAKTLDLSQVYVYHIRQEIDKEWRKKQTLQILESHLAKKNEFYNRLLFFYARELYSQGLYEKSYEAYKNVLAINQDIDTQSYVHEKMMSCLLYTNNNAEMSNLYDLVTAISHPRSCLTQADIECILKPEKAQYSYAEYINNPLEQKNTKYEYDFERYMVHPHFQLCKIAFQMGDVLTAKKHLHIVLDKTHLQETKNQAKMLLSLM